MSKIEIVNLQKTFGDFTAVKNSDLVIHDKEFFHSNCFCIDPY